MPQPPIAARLRPLPVETVQGRAVPVAVGFRSRLLGLAGLRRDAVGPGLLIPGCSSVHTFGMRFPLDLVFLDRDGRPCSFRRCVPPRRLAWDRRARAVLELPCSLGMTAREVQVPALSLEQLRAEIDPAAWDRFEDGLRRGAELFDGRRVWNVNSTSSGGGVAEMLWSWVGLARGVGVEDRPHSLRAGPDPDRDRMRGPVEPARAACGGS